MPITEEVILDLMPLYAAGECSTDTRTLVREYLAEHPEFAGKVLRIQEFTLKGKAPGGFLPEDELRTLRRTQRTLRWKRYAMGFGIFFMLAPASFVSIDGQWHWLFAGAPWAIAAYEVLAVACWIVYGYARRLTKTM